MVLNKKVTGVPPGAIYIGRPGKWGNPFAMKSEMDRDTVCDKYIIYMLDENSRTLREEARTELKGKDLVCFCAPRRCHGDILEIIANSKDDKELFELWKNTWERKDLWSVKG